MPLSLKHVKDSEICPCAKFRFNYIFVARNIANKHFSLKKAPDPGLKHLERLDDVRLFVCLFVCYVKDCGSLAIPT